MEERVEERVAIVESRAQTLESEMLRVRERLHELESDRATLRLLVRQVSELTTGVEKIAERAAERAIQMAFERRAALGRATANVRIGYIGVGVAAGGCVATLLATYLGH